MLKRKPKRKPVPRSGVTSYRRPAVDYTGLLMMFGTDSAIARAIKDASGETVPVESIAGWRRRNVVPAWWIPTVLKLAIDNRYIRDVSDLLKKR